MFSKVSFCGWIFTLIDHFLIGTFGLKRAHFGNPSLCCGNGDTERHRKQATDGRVEKRIRRAPLLANMEQVEWRNGEKRHEIRWRLLHLFRETNPGGFLLRRPPWGSTDNPNQTFTDLEAATTEEHILSNLLCSPVKSDPWLIAELLSAPNQQKRDNLGPCFRLLHRFIHKSHRRHFRNFTYNLFSGNHKCTLDNQKCN